MSYNQDAHRQRIVNWINATGGTSSAFDVTTKPTVFYDHFYDFGLRDTIVELIEARRRAGIHCRSTIKIFHANNEGYVAKIDESLVMKLGYFEWNPAKENNLDGTWQKFVDRGADYQLWMRH
ncbi:Alpha-amylase isozyme 2A [Acorus calamus]|uniref:alpha-amylase n=1 Tax=Acorus calamus TaxID=4465 RepID=A0AAV9CZ30_ACOCL|nr:Alpha-amylase isozyme 2A [Acorus calamus]